jgi:hypothetical protein
MHHFVTPFHSRCNPLTPQRTPPDDPLQGQAGFFRCAKWSNTGHLSCTNPGPDAGTLKEQMKDFKRKVSEAGRATHAARVGAHDDLVVTAAIALWMPTSGPVTTRMELRL